MSRLVDDAEEEARNPYLPKGEDHRLVSERMRRLSQLDGSDGCFDGFNDCYFGDKVTTSLQAITRGFKARRSSFQLRIKLDCAILASGVLAR